MPQAAIAALGSFFTGLIAESGIALWVKVFAYAATAYLLNRAAAALAPKTTGVGLGTGTEINYYDSGASIRIVYGQVRTGGMETIPPRTSNRDSANNRYLHKVLTLAGHEIDSYNSTHFDNVTIPNTAIGPMAFTTSDGMVTAGSYDGLAFIRRYRGTSTDSADAILTDISSTAFGNSRARGIAKVALTLKFDPEMYKSMPTITFTYQGKRCYDPRLDTTPGANPTNSSYIAWTSNPALCLCDYLMAVYGGEYDAADIDWNTVVTAANYCDGNVNIPNSLTQDRYTCNGVLLATDDFTDNVKALVDSMLGRIIFRDGKWRIYAGSWQTTTFTINKSDWISGLSIRFEQGRKRRFNRMRCWYVDSSRDWQRVQSMPRINSTFKTADGNEDIDAETEQLLCTNELEAQRKTEFLLRQSRNQITVAGRLPPRFQDIALWDTGTIVFDHLGWSTKTFRCVGCDMNPDGSMDCVFSEEQSTDWTDLASSEYNGPSIAALPAINGPFLPSVYTQHIARNAVTFVSVVNCTTAQVFSGAGALHASDLGTVHFKPSSLSGDADVLVMASYLAGHGNFNDHQNVQIRFVTGVTSSYTSPIKVPITGFISSKDSFTQTAQFSYTEGNSAFVQLQWDVASGSNSCGIEQVSIRTEFIYR